jgi:acyl-coenzyme A synthetase/AMP-(fatty) acid ligase
MKQQNAARAEGDWNFSALLKSFTSGVVLCCALQANYLRSQGVKKGDAVSIYMPMVCELPIAMLACARIGAVHSVVFGGFSAEALAGTMAATSSWLSSSSVVCDLRQLLDSLRCLEAAQQRRWQVTTARCWQQQQLQQQ